MMLGPIKYTDQEQQFAKAIQKSTGTEQKGLDGEVKPLETPKPDPPGGSTDVGDVSWVVPTLHLSVTTAPESIWHAWPVVAAGGMSIGHKGLDYAARRLQRRWSICSKMQKCETQSALSLRRRRKALCISPSFHPVRRLCRGNFSLPPFQCRSRD